MRFELKGIEELIEALNEKAYGIEKAKPVVKEHTAMLQERAQIKVPVDTGHLKRSIKIGIKDSGMTGTVRAEAEYSGYVELGTRRMAAQPYLEPALHEVEGPFIEALERIVKK